jgi:hypothetical protein
MKKQPKGNNTNDVKLETFTSSSSGGDSNSDDDGSGSGSSSTREECEVLYYYSTFCFVSPDHIVCRISLILNVFLQCGKSKLFSTN